MVNHHASHHRLSTIIASNTFSDLLYLTVDKFDFQEYLTVDEFADEEILAHGVLGYTQDTKRSTVQLSRAIPHHVLFGTCNDQKNKFI